MNTQTQPHPQTAEPAVEAPSAVFKVIAPTDGSLLIELDEGYPHPDIKMFGGDIYIKWKGFPSGAWLRFELETPGKVLDGFQLGLRGDALAPNSWRTIPFKCMSDEPRKTLELELKPLLFPLDQDGPVYSFSLFVKDATDPSKQYVHDPKIYNQGSTGGGDGPFEPAS